MRYLRTQLHEQRRLELRVAARRHDYWVSPVRTQAKLAASQQPDVLSRAISRRRRPRRSLSGDPLTPALAIRARRLDRAGRDAIMRARPAGSAQSENGLSRGNSAFALAVPPDPTWCRHDVAGVQVTGPWSKT